jgi:hypothetical protein
MNLVQEIWGVVSAIIVFVLAFVVCIEVGYKFNASKTRVIFLYLWHTLYCLVACWYSLNYVSDAFGYYQKAQMNEWAFSFGTEFVDFFTKVLYEFFGLSFVGLFLVFNLFGVIGLLAFDASLRAATIYKKTIIKILGTVIVLLPSVSFWSSAIGKDSISFMSVCLILWSSINLKRRINILFLSIILMLLVRPHIAFIMMIATAFGILFDPLTSKKSKIVISSFIIFGVLMLFPFIISFSGYDDALNISGVAEFIETRQGFNMEGGGGIDISSMNLFEQLVAYLFRPFAFEVDNIFSAAAAFDNTILLGMFFVFCINVFSGRKSNLNENRVLLWLYACLVWTLLAMTTSNMGIALRQKWMFAPILIYLVISLMGERKKIKIQNLDGNTKK